MKRVLEEGFTWCARKLPRSGRLRQVVLNEKDLPPETVRINAYSKEGDSGFHETLVNPGGAISPTR
ncbi:MAG TPA: hypothetical protein VIT18_06305, partial [Terrimicrobiaceae bacterium]